MMTPGEMHLTVDAVRYAVGARTRLGAASTFLADRLAPGARQWWQAGHRSTEPAHAVALRQLELEPIIDMRMRLGEGTGAAVALPVVRAAVAALASMATFDEAGVTA
jgi:nicotinate-nucleotide--dimethylbenzimidazole phosphoribosyltransferase